MSDLPDPWLCRYCRKVRFPTKEAREEHYNICSTKIYIDKENARSEKIRKEHHENRPPPKERESPDEVYQRWWLGKMCRVSSDREFKRVTMIECTGPPSMVYGGVILYFEDGTRDDVNYGEAFRPRKSDVEVLEE